MKSTGHEYSWKALESLDELQKRRMWLAGQGIIISDLVHLFLPRIMEN